MLEAPALDECFDLPLANRLKNLLIVVSSLKRYRPAGTILTLRSFEHEVIDLLILLI